MYTEDIHKYLKDLSTSLNRQKNTHLHINALIKSKTSDHSITIQLSDNNDTLDVKILIPIDRSTPATLNLTTQENKKNINVNIGNSRNVPLEHDINFISQIITESADQNNAVEYITNKLIEIFDKTKVPIKKIKLSDKSLNKLTISLDKDKLKDTINRANLKGANIVSWHKTPNNKIVLIYKNKENENYGSEVETNVHLFYAFLLKNKSPSTRIF